MNAAVKSEKKEETHAATLHSKPLYSFVICSLEFTCTCCRDISCCSLSCYEFTSELTIVVCTFNGIDEPQILAQWFGWYIVKINSCTARMIIIVCCIVLYVSLSLSLLLLFMSFRMFVFYHHVLFGLFCPAFVT